VRKLEALPSGFPDKEQDFGGGPRDCGTPLYGQAYEANKKQSP